MIDQDKIVQIIKNKGPCLPATVAKDLGTNIMITSAFLSELVSRKMVKVSQLKVGSSPLYLVDGQESRLMQWADQLGEKDRRTYELLNIRKVLRESTCDPLTRVSLTKIPDFAIPLTVTIDGQKERFYKWFMTTNEEASAYISKLFEEIETEQESKQTTTEQQPPTPASSTSETEPIKANEPAAESHPLRDTPPGPNYEHLNVSSDSTEVTYSTDTITTSFDSSTESIQAAPASQPAQQNEETLLKPTTEIEKSSITEEQPADKKETVPDTQPKRKHKRKSSPAPKPSSTQQAAQDDPPSEDTDVPINPLSIVDPLLDAVKPLFEDKNIEIEQVHIIRKGRELNLRVTVPSVVGKMRYFAKALNKKKTTDKDVSSAFLEGEFDKLPLLFLYTGEITKKAKTMSDRIEFRNLMLMKLDYGS